MDPRVAIVIFFLARLIAVVFRSFPCAVRQIEHLLRNLEVQFRPLGVGCFFQHRLWFMQDLVDDGVCQGRDLLFILVIEVGELAEGLFRLLLPDLLDLPAKRDDRRHDLERLIHLRKVPTSMSIMASAFSASRSRSLTLESTTACRSSTL